MAKDIKATQRSTKVLRWKVIYNLDLFHKINLDFWCKNECRKTAQSILFILYQKIVGLRIPKKIFGIAELVTHPPTYRHAHAHTHAPHPHTSTHMRTQSQAHTHSMTKLIDFLIFWREKNFEWRKSIYRFSDCFCSNCFFSLFGRRLKFSCSRRLHNVKRLEMYKIVPVIISYYFERYELF